MMKRYRVLSRQESLVIKEKGTEPPFSGAYEKFSAAGVFICRQCLLPLYLSSHKFSSFCGWPSFDDEIKGAIQKKIDKDGRRIEICCQNCGGHLGHFFEGENLSPKNIRHCVNSLSLEFIPLKTKEGYERAFFSGGCFWGVQFFLQKMKGVISVTCGYMGGSVFKPTYEEVCTGDTGHVETALVIFDPQKLTFEDLCRLFFEIHDPTQRDGQGPDLGSQYLSKIFYITKEQQEQTENLIKQLKSQGLNVVTEVLPATHFFEAEPFHQDYYKKTRKTPYCHRRIPRF